jgi:GTP pyrophosphokinase
MKSVSMQQVVERITNTKKAPMDNEALTQRFNEQDHGPARRSGSTGVQVPGIKNMKISIAGCCMPVYGDPIIGYITKGQGIKVHRADCPNIKNEKSRLIPVEWEDSDENKMYDCWLKLEAMDRSYLISDIVTVLAQYKAALTGINSEVLPDKVHATIDLRLRISSAEQLKLLMANLRKIDSVTSVERTVK